ncbi:EF-hand domain-containing protein [Halomonas sp. MS1]|nr:EF-hand domain-containing protein [Halomonas sp. MS1]UTD54913.1 EF-hand domain-containing protein [Halomonas sp. MS1]
MAKQYKTGLIITGDASGGIRAIKATDNELGKLNQGFDQGSRRSRQFNQDVNATSQGLTVLKRAAAPIAGAIAGMFAANTLQNQIDWGDQLQKTNLRIGASTEALSQYNYVAKLSGVEFGQLTTAWQRQTRRIAEAATGTGVASKALDRLGLSAKDLNQLAPEEQFERIAAAMQNVESSSERVALAQKLWDSEGVKLVQIVNQGTDAIAAMRAEADALGLTISQDTANAMATYNDEVDRLKFAAQGLSQTLAGELVPTMTSGLQATSAFIQEIGGAEVILNALTDVVGITAALLAGRYTAAVAASTQKMIARELSLRAQIKAEVAATAASTRRTAAERQSAMALLSTARIEEQATRGTAAHAFALQQLSIARVRAAEAAGAHTAATNIATAATQRGTVAARGLASAYALVGGPLGLLVGGAGLLYVFRDELNLTGQRAGLTEDQIHDLRDEMKGMSQDDLSGSLSSLNAELDTATIKAATAREELAKLRSESRGSGALGFGGGELGSEISGMQAVAEAQERIAELNDRINVARGETASRIEQNANAFVVYADRIEEANEETRRAEELNKTLSTSAADAADKTTTLANGYEDLLDRIQPNRRAARQYAKDVGVLNLALATGRMTTVQYMRAMGMLQESFQAAQRESDDLTVAVTDGSDEMTREMERFGNAVDDVFVDAFKGAFDSFEDFADGLKNAFETLMAELAYAAVKNEIKIQLGMGTSGMMQGGISQLLGGGSGGFGGIGNLISGGKSLLGMGGSSAGGLYAGAATQSAGTLYGSAATGSAIGTGAAGGGFLSSAASMAGPIAAMYGLASMGNSLFEGAGLYDALGIKTGGRSSEFLGQIAPIGGTIIGSALDALGIGGRSRGPSFDLMTTDRDPNTIFEDVQHGVTATGAFGNVGFHGGNTNRLEETFGSFDNATQFLETIAATDDMIAALAPGDIEAMTHAIQQMRLKSSDAAGIADQLGDRTKAAFGAMSGDFGAFARTLTGSTEEIIAQAQATQQAHALLTGASERLGLQFNVTGGYAYEAAQDIAQLAGGVENLAALQQSYYQNFFSEAERAAHLTADLTSALGSMGLQLPETREGFRQLVEAQDLSTESGRQAYAQLLQLSASFSELTPAVEAAGDAASGTADALREREQLERQLLTLQGNTAELRRRDLDALDSSNRSLQQRIWALEDEQEAQREAERAQQERIRAIEQEASAWQRAQQQLASFGVSIDSWIDNLRGTDAGLGTPGDQLAAASAAFDEQYAKALSGDQAALGSITQYADRFIEAQKGWSASGEQTVSTIDRVTGMLEKLPDQLSPEQFLAEEFRGIIAEQTDVLGNIFENGLSDTVAQLSKNFGEIDGNLDGLLTFRELKNALGDKATDAQISLLIAAVDTNGDGMISQQELTNSRINSLSSDIAAVLVNEFDRVDISADGLIDYDEFRNAFAGMATDEELKRIFSKLDADGSSSISIAEAQRQLLSAIRSADANTEGSIKNVEDFLYRAGSPSWGLRVSMSHHQDTDAVKSFGYHTAKEMRKEFSPSGTGIGVSLAAPQNGDGARSIANAFKQVLGANSVNGSHADGLARVPFDGYIAELHKDETVLTADQSDALRGLAIGPSMSTASMSAPAISMSAPPLPQFPLLNQSDQAQVNQDLLNEVKKLREELNRALNDVKTNTGNTADAVATAAVRAEQQRSEQTDELRDVARNSRVKGRYP